MQIQQQHLTQTPHIIQSMRVQETKKSTSYITQTHPRNPVFHIYSSPTSTPIQISISTATIKAYPHHNSYKQRKSQNSDNHMPHRSMSLAPRSPHQGMSSNCLSWHHTQDIVRCTNRDCLRRIGRRSICRWEFGGQVCSAGNTSLVLRIHSRSPEHANHDTPWWIWDIRRDSCSSRFGSLESVRIRGIWKARC
jgi:hypothetical protein